MKRFLALAIFIFSFTVHASIVTFECKSVEVQGVHKFDARGIVTIDEYNKVDGIISIQTQKAQAEGSAQIFEEIKVNGTHQRFEAGQMSKFAFDQLTLFTKQAYIKSMNLLLNLKVEIASQIFSIDNFVYRSNCYTIENSNRY